MHGPEKGNYENHAVFTAVQAMERIAWTRISQPHFDMEVLFQKLDEFRSKITFLMRFKTAEDCAKIKRFAEPKNEENFDRLEREIRTIKF